MTYEDFKGFGEEFDVRGRNEPNPYKLKNKKLRDAQIEANRLAEHELIEEFGVALQKAYGEHLTDEAHDILFRTAWSDGHHAGFSEAEHHYFDKLEFFDRLTEANKKGGAE